MSEIAIVGAGVSGLTCAVLLAERGARVTIFADEIGADTTSATAGAIWLPYDAEPFDRVIAWSLRTLETLRRLATEPANGVSMVELRCFARTGEIALPDWSVALGARRLTSGDGHRDGFTSGFALNVPLIDPGVYLPWLTNRFFAAGGQIHPDIHLERIEEIPREFEIIVNCAGVGARELVADAEVEPHRGQVVLVERGKLDHAIVCNDPPLMYAFPRGHDCVFGGTNEISADRRPRPAETALILEECARVLQIAPPPILGERVGLRPFRKAGVRLERESSVDGRALIHNYGHGGSGFTLSWGCAEEAAQLARL